MDFVKLCLEAGAARAEEIPVDKIVFQKELRKFCEQNMCGRFGCNYTCPPYIGDEEYLISRIKSYSNAVIWQNIYMLEDSFDFEGMMDGQRKHNSMTLEIAVKAREILTPDNILVLGAGGCMLCDICSVKTNTPCRFPDDALSSLEAYCINVSEIGRISGLKYINGINTVTYFSGLFWHAIPDDNG